MVIPHHVNNFSEMFRRIYMKKTTKQNERYEWNDVDNDDDNDDNDGDDERQQWNSCFARFMNVYFLL